jgi:hypothetical protein
MLLHRDHRTATPAPCSQLLGRLRVWRLLPRRALPQKPLPWQPRIRPVAAQQWQHPQVASPLHLFRIVLQVLLMLRLLSLLLPWRPAPCALQLRAWPPGLLSWSAAALQQLQREDRLWRVV